MGGRAPAAPATGATKTTSVTGASGAKAPTPVHTPDATVAHQLLPNGSAVEQWLAGGVTDEQRDQLVMVTRETTSNSAEPSALGRRTLLVFDWQDGQWRRRLSAPALLPCASCVSLPDEGEVRIRLSLSNDRPRNIELWFAHGWVGGVGITLRYFRDYGFVVSSLSQSGASQGLTRSLTVTYSSVSVDPIEGRIVSSSYPNGTTVTGEPWFDVRAIPPRWIAAETADYRRLLDLFGYDPAHQALPLNPARSLEDFY